MLTNEVPLNEFGALDLSTADLPISALGSFEYAGVLIEDKNALKRRILYGERRKKLKIKT